MPEPFKNLFNETVITGMAQHFVQVWPEFDRDGFINAAMKNFEDLELKQRSSQITDALVAFLPEDFDHAGKIMLASLAPASGDPPEFTMNPDDLSKEGIEGWGIMPMVDYVGLYGQDHFDLSMTLFKELTIRSSSEGGIRYFLIAYPERTLSVLASWVTHPNQHVRRLISEGTRPRLPWNMQLTDFVKDPTPVLALLEALKDDEEEYVRRSVANNLNDIAKDHPGLVAEIAGRWMKGASKNRQRLVRHGCRTLIKQGHPETLKALGYGKPQVFLESLVITTPLVLFGESLNFEMILTSTIDKGQKLIIDYAVHHQKANGKTSPKVFKWKAITLVAETSLTADRKHPMRKITTRTYYPGTHLLEIFINGESQGTQEFELMMP